MPMREECKNFESRTYPDGETVRKCNLDLAPEAPWRCPESCPKYERRLADVPVAGQQVVIRLRVRRFLCRTLDCARRIFTEQLAG